MSRRKISVEKKETINVSFYIMVKIVSPFGCTSNDLRSNANLMLRSHIWSLPSNNKRSRKGRWKIALFFDVKMLKDGRDAKGEERTCIKSGFAVHSRNSPRYTPRLMAREISGNDVCETRKNVPLRFFI